MKKITCILLLIFSMILFAQTPDKSGTLFQDAPNWAKLMYGNNANVNEVEKLYKAYYKENEYVKSYHTQYYKRWRKAINNFLNDDGVYDHEKKLKLKEVLKQRSLNETANRLVGNWSVLGPFQNFSEGGAVSSGAQGNIYSVGQCLSDPNAMYCGTENGEIYKTVDGGENWFNASLSLITALAPQVVLANSGVAAIAVHPVDSNIVYAGAGSEIFKTTDGGLSWNVVFDSNITLSGYIENPAEIFINPDNPQIVLVASKAGMHRSTNGGSTWSQTLNFECFDVKAKPGDPNVLYTVRRNNATNLHQFLRSNNGGITWTSQNNGWYNSTNASRTVVGARIAVSDADVNRVYAYLIGDSKPGDNGFIGVYRSNDSGTSWFNTMGYDGAPYTATGHPNLISSTPVTSDFSFNQGFYNCAIMASNTNADEILVGGIGMWRSSDGGTSYECIYNYVCGDYEPMHVDMQDFRAFGNEYWASTDGGIYKSLDLFASQPEFKMNGVHGVDFWGFDSGWNNDLLVGGTFHNGVDVYYEGFPNGSFLDLGGGEPASGYVNPGNALRIYSTNIGSKIIPQSINGAILNASIEMLPNESPWFAESSEMEFHPSCYNIVYLGKDNQLFKSVDGGASFTSVFSASPNSEVLGIEISRDNTDTMYIVVRPDSGNASVVKTTNDWETNSIVNLPGSAANRAIISLDPENDNTIWMAYPRGNDANKVFKSANGGMSWTNETSNELDGQNIQSLITIGGTNGGVYVGTSASVYYKNNSMSSWAIDNSNLPATIGTNALKPFYRDGKIRLASYGKGIWESPLYETPSRPVAKIMVDRLSANCAGDIFYFDDYSMLNHSGAIWSWTFEDANIMTSSVRNPEVSFNSSGTHLVSLTVTNAAGISSTDTLIIEIEAVETTVIEQDFEVDLVPENWFLEASGNFNWSYNNSVGGFGESTNSMFVNNFAINEVGESSDIVAPINLENVGSEDANLIFDVAYAQYSDAYADGLEVLLSTDCGATYTSVYNKVGTDLATAPDTTVEFLPTDTQWRTETIDLTAYLGFDTVFVKFRNINAFGNALYVDNINLGNTELSIADFLTDELLIFPNPVGSNGAITIKSSSSELMQLKLYDMLGKLVLRQEVSTNQLIPLNHLDLNTGLYLYELTSETRIKKGKLLVSTER